MFKSRLEMIAYIIAWMTERPIKECEQEAIKYDNKEFIIKHTLD